MIKLHLWFFIFILNLEIIKYECKNIFFFGGLVLGEYFEGHYYKHQKGENTLCFIVGKSTSEEFIQIVANSKAYHVPFIGENQFSFSGIKVDIDTEQVRVEGEITYKELSPIKYDVMGPLKYIPLECRHKVVSMYHKLSGKVILNNEEFDFEDGAGYIEGDSGTSFPKAYLWIQSNDFPEKCSIMASVADVPVFGVSIRGCICIIQYQGEEYRLSSYLGGRLLKCSKNQIIFKQGKYKLEINVDSKNGLALKAPTKGEMTRIIYEDASCPANFKFYRNKELIFNMSSLHTSFEYENI